MSRVCLSAPILALAFAAVAQEQGSWESAPPRRATFVVGSPTTDVVFLGADRVVSASADGVLRFWAVSVDEGDEPADETEPERLVRAHARPIYSIAVTRNGRWLASTDLAGAVHLFDLEAGDPDVPVRRFATAQFAARDIVFAPDGGWLAFSGADGEVRRFDLEMGEEAPPLSRDGEPIVKAVAFSPSRPEWLASGYTDRKIRIWSLADGDVVRDLEGHEGHLSDLAFTPVGDRLASSAWDNTVRIWNPETGEQMAQGSDDRGPGTEHVADPGSLVFTPDGRRLVSGGSDGVVRLWSVPDLEEQRAWQADPESVDALALAPGGLVLATGGRAGTVILWRLPSDYGR